MSEPSLNSAPTFQPQASSSASSSVKPSSRRRRATTALVSVASALCQLTPAPSEMLSFTLKATDGLTLIVFSSDLMPRKRPIQLLSYSVFRPKGAPTPSPTAQRSPIGAEKYRLGTKRPAARVPPSLVPEGDAATGGLGSGWQSR